jgi:hypothetical protein
VNYNEPNSVMRVAIVPDFSVGGVAITLGLRNSPTSTAILRIGENGHQTFEEHEGLVAIEHPTMRLSDEFAMMLLEELLRHYQGASDMHTVRSDLLHERGRVDRLIDTLSGIATEAVRYGVE